MQTTNDTSCRPTAPPGPAAAATSVPMPVLLKPSPARTSWSRASGILNTTTSLEVSVGPPHNSLDYEHAGPSTCTGRTRGSPASRTSTRMPSRPTTSRTSTSAADARATPAKYQTDRGPFSNENTTYDVVANLTKIWGSHTAKVGVYFQSSYKPQSIFASFNARSTSPTTRATPTTRGSATPTRRPGSSTPTPRPTSTRMPEWVYKNFEWYAPGQLEGQLAAHPRLRRPLLLHDAAVGHDAPGVSNFLPDEFDAANAAQLYTPVCIGAYPCSGANLRGMDPARSPRTTPTVDEHGSSAGSSDASSRLEPLQRRLPGRPGHQRHDAERERLQGLAALRLRRSTSPARARPSSAAAAASSTTAPGQHGVRHDRQRPGHAAAERRSGDVSRTSAAGGRRPLPHADAATRPRTTSSRPRSTAWNVGVQHKVWKSRDLRHRLRRLLATEPAAQEQINAVPLGAAFQPENQDPTLAPSTDAGRRRPCPPTSCGPTRATATSACGTTTATPTTTRCRRRSTGGSTTG